MENRLVNLNLAVMYMPNRMELITMINLMRNSLGITQEDLANLIESNKVRVSRIIGKNPRNASYDELVTMYNYLRAKKSKLPPDLTVRQFFLTRNETRELVCTSLQESVGEMIVKMNKHDFSQLPVYNQRRDCLGIISEHGIVRKIHEYGFQLKEIKLFDIQEVIEGVPTISDNTKFIEAILILDLHYAVLLESEGEIVDILTRNDVISLFSEEKVEVLS